MKTKTLRIVIPLAILLIAGIGFAFHLGVGNLSAFGWEDVSFLCPLGALGSMLATKTFIPKAVISLVIAVVLILLLGRAFCGWACPVPVVSKLREVFSKKKALPDNGIEPGNECSTAVLTEKEKEALKTCRTCPSSCSSCADVRSKVDSRHFILGGSLLSAAIFGFPVFCLICPIGLSFATIFLVILLFSGGDVTWSLILVPALLIAEVVLFRKWCSRICPISAIMSLIGKGNKTVRPVIDNAKCLETAHDTSCGRCALACEQAINPRHPEMGASWSECTRCRACVDVCPSHAITIPFLPPKGGEGAKAKVPAKTKD